MKFENEKLTLVLVPNQELITELNNGPLLNKIMDTLHLTGYSTNTTTELSNDNMETWYNEITLNIKDYYSKSGVMTLEAPIDISLLGEFGSHIQKACLQSAAKSIVILSCTTDPLESLNKDVKKIVQNLNILTGFYVKIDNDGNLSLSVIAKVNDNVPSELVFPKNAILDMLKAQYELNQHTCGPDWVKENRNIKNGKLMNFRLAGIKEATELIDTISWEWWKKSPNYIDSSKDIKEYDNITLELVDIWHFLLSSVIKTVAVSENLLETDKSEELLETTAIIFEELLNPITIFNWINELDIEVEKLVDDTDKYNSFLSELLIDTTLEFMTAGELSTGLTAINKMFYINGKIFNNPEYGFDIYRIYLGKNCLNKFRQDNGYGKDYKKLWGDVEDNVHMIKFVRTLNKTNLDPEVIYNHLAEEYAKFNVAL